MSRRGAAAALLLLLGLAGCRHAAGPEALPPALAAQLGAGPGRYVTGEPRGLAPLAVLDRKDFHYALAWAPDSGAVAFSHLGPHDFQLALWRLGEAAPHSDRGIAPLELEVEGLAYSPDGRHVAAVSRGGSVQLYAAEDGRELARAQLDEPLVSVAFHPQGRFLVAGGARGRLTVLEAPGLGFVAEVQGHTGEVRALAFAPDGTLYSGGWDRRVRVWETREAALAQDAARLAFAREGGLLQVRGQVNDRASVRFALDLRAPALVLGAEAAGRAGLDVARLTETRVLATPLGQVQARVARGQRLRFKGLQLQDVEVAVCDACLPPGAQGVLGAPAAALLEVLVDEVAGEVLLTRRAPAGHALPGLALRARADFPQQAFVNDLDLDARGERLALALSEPRAERTLELYRREKAGVREPRAAHNAAVLLDARSGRELQRWVRHAGVVSTVALSPDGRSLASGGWDGQLYLFAQGEDLPRAEERFGFGLRRVRFSPDGQLLGVAAWTPQNLAQRSDPAAVLYRVRYRAPRLAQ